MSFKRNQIEQAIGRIFDPSSQGPRSELRTRIKRLLDLDRAFGRNPRSRDAEEANFGFFSETPGTGADNRFSDYEAFALLNGLQMMEHGWPQSFVVSVMRRVRPDLEREHARILGQNPDELFDQKAILAKVRDGLFVTNTDPVFFTMASKPLRPGEVVFVCAVCRGFESVCKFTWEQAASSATTFEMTTMAHRLHEELLRTRPRYRGRG